MLNYKHFKERFSVLKCHQTFVARGRLSKGHLQLSGRTPGALSWLCLFGLAPGPQLHGLAYVFFLKTDHLVLFQSSFSKRWPGAMLFADSQTGHRTVFVSGSCKAKSTDGGNMLGS